MTSIHKLKGALAKLALPLLLLTSLAVPARAQVPTTSQIHPSGGGIGTVSTDTALLIKYIGSSASGLVAVAAGGDITFTQGVLASEAATTTFECPVSGGLGGVIDVSDAACNTLGEVCDIVNGAGGATETGWLCVILDGLRSDSSNDTLVTISGTQAKVTGGLALAHDDAVAFTTTYAVVPPELRVIEAYARVVNNAKSFYQAGQVFNTFYIPSVCSANATTTFGSGTSIWSAQAISYTGGSKYTLGSETSRTLLSTAGGATTVNKDYGSLFPHCLYGRPGEKIISTVVNSAALSAATHYAAGKYLKASSPPYIP